MGKQMERFDWVNRVTRWTMYAVFVLLAVALVATVGKLVVTLLDSPAWISVAPWAVLIIGELVAVGCTLVFYGGLRVVVANEAAVNQSAGRLARVEALLERIAGSAEQQIELGRLSDQAKSLIFREREMEAFREVIRDDLMKQDYQTAEKLIDAIEEKFGYADEATRLREEVADSRKATIEEKIEAAVGRVRELIAKRNWARAIRETKRLQKLFPKNEKINALPERIEKARTEHKRRLLEAYDEAVRKNDIELGVDLLKELDQYLTPQEAAALAESARGVFRAKLHNLGVQFAISVTDQQWAKAVATGDEIIRNYPNSRMAHEVRTKMDQLRQLAAGVQQSGRQAQPATPPAEGESQSGGASDGEQ